MRNFVKRFTENEEGNAVVDWVVLTAGIVTLGITVGIMIAASSNSVATDINTAMESMEPAMTGS
jgi:Flp pilus assembly pilin Flp